MVPVSAEGGGTRNEGRPYGSTMRSVTRRPASSRVTSTLACRHVLSGLVPMLLLLVVVGSACSGADGSGSGGDAAGGGAAGGDRGSVAEDGALGDERAADPQDVPGRPAPGTVAQIDSAAARALIDSERRVLVVDVRSLEEYMAGHLVGAQHIPIDDEGLWERRTSALDPDVPTIVYCRTGDRSADAAQLLVDQGFNEVYDVGGVKDLDPELLPLDR